MKQYIILACWLCIGCTEIGAQNLIHPSAALFSGLDAYSQYEPDAFGFTRNVAALQRYSRFQAGIRSERRFMLAETGMTELVMGFPLLNGFAGCHGQWAGGTLYKEYAVTTAYALSLSKKLTVGANVMYQGAVARGFDRTSFIQGGLGILFKSTPTVSFGLRLQSTIAGGSKKLNHADGRFFMAWGLGCDLNNQVHLMFEISYDQDFPVICTGALIYDITDRFDIRMAARTDTRSGFLSAGFQTGHFRVCVSGSYQSVLGYTPAATILYHSNQPAS